MNRYEPRQNENIPSNKINGLQRIFSLPDIHKNQSKYLEDINKPLLSPRKIKRPKINF
jgi:hypothetical protein